MQVLLAWICCAGVAFAEAEAPISDLTQECIECHASIHPGIVADWKRSRHSKVTPAQALKKPKLKRRVSADKVPENLTGNAVGCAECHMMNPASHKDTFDHNDQEVHIMVSPRDCSTCHPEEAEQFDKNIMSWARVNLKKNKLYTDFVKSVNGPQRFHGGKITTGSPDEQTNADSCFHCHGTEVRVTGKITRETDQGEMEFPVLSGWPNQGVGRFNTDGSKGSCSACHSRHQFSIEMARKPYTCAQCHKGPDVPAYPAYQVSKHGNLFRAMGSKWDFNAVPWMVGKDFTAPTCAVCHVSQVVTEEGDVIAKRTHQMNDRLPWRILGLIYAHPHPLSPDTSIIENAQGMPLPTSLTGEPASKYLIDKKEMQARQTKMQAVCRSCHSSDWVDGHWKRFENTIKTTNEATLTATRIVSEAWEKGVADKKSLFDEAIEKQWVEQWLFYANSTRFASAMMGADYGVFDNGRWFLSKNIRDMLDRFKLLLNSKGKLQSKDTNNPKPREKTQWKK
ncbi:multiheme c-type cytochrome [Thermodesulfobacteriota bacterium]